VIAVSLPETCRATTCAEKSAANRGSVRRGERGAGRRVSTRREARLHADAPERRTEKPASAMLRALVHRLRRARSSHRLVPDPCCITAASALRLSAAIRWPAEKQATADTLPEDASTTVPDTAPDASRHLMVDATPSIGPLDVLDSPVCPAGILVGA